MHALHSLNTPRARQAPGALVLALVLAVLLALVPTRVLADPAAATGAGLVLGAAMLSLAAYLTLWWQALRPLANVAGWLATTALWAGAMLLLDPALAPYRHRVASWLAQEAMAARLSVPLVIAGLLLVTAGILSSGVSRKSRARRPVSARLHHLKAG